MQFNHFTRGGKMLSRQKQVCESLLRVQDWLSRNPPPAGEPIARVCAEYGDVVARVQRTVGHQSAGRRLSLSATVELRHAVRRLRQDHLRPIAVIARACRSEDLAMDQALRLPDRRLPVTKLLAEAGAIRNCVRQKSDWFIRHGRDQDFVAQLDQAMAAVGEAARRRDRAKSLQVGATAGLQEHLRKARQLLQVLDCWVTSTHANDGAALAAWRVSRRVRLQPGGVGEAPLDEHVEVPDDGKPVQLTIAA
jgi:hypothetical protein